MDTPPLDDIDEVEVPEQMANSIQRYADSQGMTYGAAVLNLLSYALLQLWETDGEEAVDANR
jgi:hypothetical protein